ncbi:MAG: hypothetical protein KF819_18145 [Labilithrix sp.]|nr:hypothetical protein [Labilithrix sp.]
MRAALLLSCVSCVSLVLLACAASAPTEPPAAAAEPATPLPPADAGAAKPDAAPDAPGKPKNDCKLAPMTDVADVTPAFLVHAPPATAPRATTGGALSGQYTIDKATVYLPSGAAGLIDPRASSGTINGWAIFSGTDYRLRLTASFTIASVLGPQTQGVDTSSQGGFTVSGSALTLDHACDATIDDEADYTFTDDGGGRATLLIKTPTPYGDTYLELEAAKD